MKRTETSEPFRSVVAHDVTQKANKKVSFVQCHFLTDSVSVRT